MKCFQNELSGIGLVTGGSLFNSCIITAMLVGLSLMVAPRLVADEVEANLIQIIDTSNFPAPDPAGIVYLPSLDAFLVSDSEINEMTIFQRVNIFKVDLYGGLIDTFSTIPFSKEPTGITINSLNNHCFFSDDDIKKVYEVDPGNDGFCLTSDDIVTSFTTDNHFGSSDPEDVTYGLESLFIVDGNNNRVYRISNNNGVFNNVTVDNLVNSFNTKSLGVTNPEGITFDSTNNSLFVVGSHEPSIIQTTTYGMLLNTIDISALNAVNPSGLARAPSSENPTMTNLYMVARGVDNNTDATENDGKIYELGLPATTANNSIPDVLAGDDQAIILPEIDSVELNGAVTDDGLPNSELVYTWSKQSGPGEVSFTDPNNLNTAASFSTTGSYVLRLTGYDGDLYSFDDLSIVVSSHIPVITVNGANPMSLDLGETFIDPGATALDDIDGDLTTFIQSTSNVDTSIVGIYQVTYTVTDSEGYSESASRRIVVSDEIYSLQSRVSTSADDAEERIDGRMYLSSSDLDLVVDKQLQTIGVRFSDLSIPTTAIITKVYIQFQADEADILMDSQLEIVAQRTANAPSFTSTNYNISSRSKTTASVSWTVAAWSTVGEAGEDQRTPELSAVVQEIVSETGWNSGNAIAFIFTGTGTRTAEAYDGEETAAPLLYIEYTTDNSNAPVLTLLGDNPLTININSTFVEPGASAQDDVDGDISTSIVFSGTVDTNTAGTYLLTYSVTDSDGNGTSVTRSVIVSNGSSEVTVLQSSVSAGSDDAKERMDGKVYLGSTDLELVFDNNSLQTIGVRFTDLSIPANAIISKAYIQFQADEVDTLANIQLNIVAQRTSNAPSFTTTDYNISSRSKTNTLVSWSPPAWSIVGEAGENQRTPDLSAIVQEIVSETDWNSGNGMAFIFTGTGRRVAESYNGDRAGAPLLHLEYSSE